MTAQDRATLNTYFETGDTPTQAEFIDLVDSFPLVSEPPVAFDTLSDMQSATTLADKQVVVLKGRAAAGDGGGNVFTYHATGRPTADNVFRFNGAGADDYFVAMATDVATTKQAGAKADGVTNDAGAIQALFDALPYGGRAIVSPGVHIINTTVYPLSNQTVEFRGSLKLADGGTALTTGMIRVNESGVTLLNPQCDYDASNNTDNGSPGTQPTIANYVSGTNLHIIGGSLTNNLDNGFAGGKSGLLIDGLSISNTDEHAIYISGGGSESGITIRDCTIDSPSLGVYSDAHAIQIKNVSNVVCSDNIVNCGATPVSPCNAYNLDNVTRCSIKGGIYRNMTNAAIDISGTSGGSSDILIEGGFYVRGSGGSTISAVRKFTNVSNVRVVDCVFSGYSSTQDQPDLWLGCQFKSVSTQIVIENYCEFRGCTFDFTSGTRYIDMDANTCDVVDCRFTGTTATVGIFCDGTVPASSRCRVIGNVFTNKTSGNVVQLSGGSNHYVAQNSMPVSASSQVIWVGSAAGGINVLRDNYMPSGTGTLGGYRVSTGSIAQIDGRQNWLYDIGDVTGNYTPDFAAYGTHNLMINATGDITFDALTAELPGEYCLLLKSSVDETNRVLAWPATVKGSPPTGVSDADGLLVRLFYDGTNFHV